MEPGLLAKLAALAYSPAEDLPAGAFVIQNGSARAVVFPPGMVVCGIVLNHQIIAFTGTQVTGPLVQEKGDLGDLVANLHSRLVTWPGPGRIAKGYWHHARKLLGVVLALMKPGCIFIGHSMGGVIAQALGELAKPSAVVCFGPPRAFDAGAVGAFTVPVTNYIGTQDFWCHAPFWESDRCRPGEEIEVDSDHFGYVEALADFGCNANLSTSKI